MPAVQPTAEISSPVETYSHPTTCPSCNRRYDENERRSSYNGVEVCAGCKALQQVGDFGGLFQEIFTSLSREIEALKQERI